MSDAHDSHGHDHGGHDHGSHGDDHGHGHEEHWGDYNAEPPPPSTLPPLTAVHLSVLGVALAVLLAAIVGFSLRLSEARMHASHESHDSHEGAVEHKSAEHGAEKAEKPAEKHGKEH